MSIDRDATKNLKDLFAGLFLDGSFLAEKRLCQADKSIV